MSGQRPFNVRHPMSVTQPNPANTSFAESRSTSLAESLMHMRTKAQLRVGPQWKLRMRKAHMRYMGAVQLNHTARGC